MHQERIVKISFLSLTGVNGNQFIVVSLLRWPLRNSASVLHLILEHGASQPFSSFLAEVLFFPLRALLIRQV